MSGIVTPPMRPLYKTRSAPSLCSLMLDDTTTRPDPAESSSSRSPDPYQLFQICSERCHVLTVHVIKGDSITRGKIKDWLYRPDPYVRVSVPDSPNPAQQTNHVASSVNPAWDQRLTFYVDPYRDRLLEFVLFDQNRTVNEEIGRQVVETSVLLMDDDSSTICFRNGSKIQVKVSLERNYNFDMRFDLSLCQEEQQFLCKREKVIKEGLQKFLQTSSLSSSSPSAQAIASLKVVSSPLRAPSSFTTISPASSADLFPSYLPSQSPPFCNSIDPALSAVASMKSSVSNLPHSSTDQVISGSLLNTDESKTCFDDPEPGPSSCPPSTPSLPVNSTISNGYFTHQESQCSSESNLSSTDLPKKLPKIALISSGGGFRAMIAYSGAFKALQSSGLLDCIHYTAALSGSSWYLSTLYSHPAFPSPEATHLIIPELRRCVEKHWQVHLSPPWSSRYLKKIIKKSIQGQPVSFTDFFGYLVGEQLLKGRMKSKLSDQKEKISNGSAPLPMYTCVHVKKNISAKVFQEWYEFTPYEVSIPKYGISMPSPLFGSKYYMGKALVVHKEIPLHFLYGVWGSAFTILAKRLVQEKDVGGRGEIIKMVNEVEQMKDIQEEEGFIPRKYSIIQDINDALSSRTYGNFDNKDDLDDQLNDLDDQLSDSNSNYGEEDNEKPMDLLMENNIEDEFPEDEKIFYSPSNEMCKSPPIEDFSEMPSEVFRLSPNHLYQQSPKSPPQILSESPQFSWSLESPNHIGDVSLKSRLKLHGITDDPLDSPNNGSPRYGESPRSLNGILSDESPKFRPRVCEESPISPNLPHESPKCRNGICGESPKCPTEMYGESPKCRTEMYGESPTCRNGICGESPRSITAVYGTSPSDKSDDGNAPEKSDDLKRKKSFRNKLSKFSFSIKRKSSSEDCQDKSRLSPKVNDLEKISPTPSECLEELEREQSRVEKVLEKSLISRPIDTRAGRAGLILNPMRGLTANETFPRSPSRQSPSKPTDKDNELFKGYNEPMKTDNKRIYLVDSGLSFNLPFPVLLRPQRKIQLYITFDFSSRTSDSTPPFRELLLSEKWARLHKLPFPNIRDQVKDLMDKPVEECYVFKNTEDINCPVIVLFPLVNKNFRTHSAPGVLREPDDQFGNFDIFDKTSDYAIWRFVYPNLAFDRLAQMMEFNVLNNTHVVKQEIEELMRKNN